MSDRKTRSAVNKELANRLADGDDDSESKHASEALLGLLETQAHHVVVTPKSSVNRDDRDDDVASDAILDQFNCIDSTVLYTSNRCV